MKSLTDRTLLDRYYLRELVGSGGMADVYLAWDKLRSVKLAIKVLRRDLSNNTRFFQLFTKEADILRTLEHPNIVRLYEFDKEEDIAFIVMDWVDGSNLRQLIQNSKKPLSLANISTVLEAVCSALHYAHGNQIYHCDIKPANIMLHVDGRVLLTDFGVAHMADETGGGGTPPYMAPEQFTGDRIDARTDVYSLGITLFEVFSFGKTPFRGASSSSQGGTTKERIAWEHLNLPAPTLSQINPMVSDAVAQVVNTAIQKEPKQRYQSVLALRDAFEKARSVSAEDNSLSSQTILNNLTTLANTAASAVTRVLPKPGQSDYSSKYPAKASQAHSSHSLPGIPVGRNARPKPNSQIRGNEPYLLCRSGQWAGHTIAIPSGETVIGRGSQSHIKLSESIISRRHATIIRTKRGVYIRDDSSAQGTYVNGQHINGPVLLHERDVIQIGYQQVFEFWRK